MKKMIITDMGDKDMDHVKAVVDFMYIHRPELLDTQRNLLLECGKLAYYRLLDIFGSEIVEEIANQILERHLPTPIDNYNGELMLKPVSVVEDAKVFLPGIGYVSLVYTPDFDYDVTKFGFNKITQGIVLITSED